MKKTAISLILLACASAASAQGGAKVQAVASARIVSGETIRMDETMGRFSNHNVIDGRHVRRPLERSISKRAIDAGDAGQKITITEFY